MIIKLYDNEDYEYPLLEIKEECFEEFEELLKEYSKDEYYNIDDFLTILETKDFYVGHISIDKEVFF